MVDRAVGVRQLVPERNDGWHVGNLGGESRPMLNSYTERLADDFELSLDGGAQEDLRRVVFVGLPSRKVRQQIACREDAH
jgi:hypothetical protein